MPTVVGIALLTRVVAKVAVNSNKKKGRVDPTRSQDHCTLYHRTTKNDEHTESYSATYPAWELWDDSMKIEVRDEEAALEIAGDWKTGC